jgi:asparagine synthetase B (glutamine-hydrolysing)
MCGIAGIIGRIDQANRAALERMNDAMLHRGTDANGVWCSPPDERGWGALLAHRRLAILDLSPAGVQPMIDPVTGHVITFNGEIYNYRDLRRRLESEGQQFQSSGDTAVMLRALGLYGPGAVSWLRGTGSIRYQASLCGAFNGSECRLVDCLRLGASGVAGLRAARHAATRSAGCSELCVERLCGRP